MNLFLIAAALTILLADPQLRQSPEGFQFEHNSQGVRVTENGRPVLFYQAANKSKDGKFTRSNYVHPLYDLDGKVITEDFPDDHLHQRGIFWAWHQVLVNGKSVGNTWLTDGIVWEVRSIQTSQNESIAEICAEVIWSSKLIERTSSRPVPIVRQCVNIRVHPAEESSRKVDFEICLTALVDNLSIGGSTDNKGYGGFSARFKLPGDVKFLSHQGPIQPKRTAVDAGAWVDLQANFGEGDSPSGVAILCHPSSPGFPQKWILRESRSMQNPVFPGRVPVAVLRSEPMKLRYRLVLHRGKVESKTIDRWQSEFAQDAPNRN